ncbi:MAG: hypothetical protein WCS96_06860 [Victivallales bacterium]|jgi:hypothetical protein
MSNILEAGQYPVFTMLALDDSAFNFRSGLGYHITKPTVINKPVLTPAANRDAPDAGAAHFYGSIICDEGKYRMWYYAVHFGKNPDWDEEKVKDLEEWKNDHIQGPVCYAESEDGINWMKPALRQVKFKGSFENNVIDLPNTFTSCVNVIKDEGDPDPARRYKMVYQYWVWNKNATRGERCACMRTATSHDGIHWTAGVRSPINEFVEWCGFYKYNGYYIINAHTASPFQFGYDGKSMGRQGVVWISPDFDNWISESAFSFTLSEPEAIPERGQKGLYDQVHLGTAAMNYGNVLAGIYCRWRNDRDFSKISGDLCFVISNDGIRFREPEKGLVWLKSEEFPATPASKVPGKTVLCQSNGFINVGNETRIYLGKWFNAVHFKDYYAEIGYVTIPRDRWGCYQLWDKYNGGSKDILIPELKDMLDISGKGTLWSEPVRLPKENFEVFFNAAGALGISLELHTERFSPLGGYTGSIQDDNGFELPLSMKKDIGGLKGQVVRFKFNFKRSAGVEPKLYAMYIRKVGHCHLLQQSC